MRRRCSPLSWRGAHCGEVAAQRITGDPAAYVLAAPSGSNRVIALQEVMTLAV